MSTDTYEFQSLKDAIYNDYIETIQQYVSLSDPNIPYINKGLIIASQCGRLEIARLFLQKKIKHDTIKEALKIAVENNDIKIVKLLLEKNTDRDILRNHLEKCYDDKNFELFRLFVIQGADSFYVFPKAIQDNNLEVLKVLCNESPTWRYSLHALYKACEFQNLEAIRFLIEVENVDYTENLWSHSVLDQVISSGNTEILDYFETLGVDMKNSELLIKACRYHKINTVQYFIDKKTVVTYESNFPIIIAASWGDLDIVELLIKNGADIYAQDNKAFILACKNGKSKVVEYIVPLIISQNKDVDITLNIGLEKAKNNNYYKIVSYLKGIIEDYRSKIIVENNEKFMESVKSAHLPLSEFLETLEENQQHKTDNKCIIC